jgi:hypothetical protein
MEPFEPDFELIKMDAEIGSYQEDFDPADPGDAAPTEPEPALFEPGE